MIAVIAAIIFCAFAWYKRWLDAGGAIAADILGILVLLAGGWQLALPMLVFFISASLMGKLPAYSTISGAKTKKPRDFIQVICNGSVSGVCILLYLFTKNHVFVTAYFLSIAISTADTWSSELGLYFSGEVVDILSLNKISKGLSGGISVMGTLAGLLGSVFIALVYLFLFKGPFKAPLLISIGGFAGMMLDSVLGSWLQATYCLGDGIKTEVLEPGETAVIEKGFSWMTNDLVNLVSNLLLTILGILVMGL